MDWSVDVEQSMIGGSVNQYFEKKLAPSRKAKDAQYHSGPEIPLCTPREILFQEHQERDAQELSLKKNNFHCRAVAINKKLGKKP